MGKNDIVKKIIDVNKTCFENYFSMMVLFQDQTEDIWKNIVNRLPGMDDANKEIMEEWLNVYKKSREDFKKAIDSGYAKAEAFFDYNAILAFQEQNEKIFKSFFEQAGVMPGDFKKAVDELASLYKRNCNDFKKYVEENVNRVKDFVSAKEEPKAQTRRKTS